MTFGRSSVLEDIRRLGKEHRVANFAAIFDKPVQDQLQLSISAASAAPKKAPKRPKPMRPSLIAVGSVTGRIGIFEHAETPSGRKASDMKEDRFGSELCNLSEQRLVSAGMKSKLALMMMHNRINQQQKDVTSPRGAQRRLEKRKAIWNNIKRSRNTKKFDKKKMKSSEFKQATQGRYFSVDKGKTVQDGKAYLAGEAHSRGQDIIADEFKINRGAVAAQHAAKRALGMIAFGKGSIFADKVTLEAFRGYGFKTRKAEEYSAPKLVQDRNIGASEESYKGFTTVKLVKGYKESKSKKRISDVFNVDAKEESESEISSEIGIKGRRSLAGQRAMKKKQQQEEKSSMPRLLRMKAKAIDEDRREIPFENVMNVKMNAAGPVIQYGLQSTRMKKTKLGMEALFACTVMRSQDGMKRFSRVEVLDVDGHGNSYVDIPNQECMWTSMDALKPHRGGLGVLSDDGLFIATVISDFHGDEMIVSRGDEVEVVALDKEGLAGVRSYVLNENNLELLPIMEGVMPLRLLMKHPRRGGRFFMSDQALCIAEINQDNEDEQVADVADFAEGDVLIKTDESESWFSKEDVFLGRGGPGVDHEDALVAARRIDTGELVEIFDFNETDQYRITPDDEEKEEWIDRKDIKFYSRLGGLEPMSESALCSGTCVEEDFIPAGAIIDLVKIRFEDELIFTVNCNQQPSTIFHDVISLSKGGAGVWTEEGLFIAVVLEEIVLQEDDDNDKIHLKVGDQVQVMEINGLGKCFIVDNALRNEAWIDINKLRPLSRAESLDDDVFFTANLKEGIRLVEKRMLIAEDGQIDVVKIESDGTIMVRVRSQRFWIEIELLEPNRGGIGVSGPDVLLPATLRVQNDTLGGYGANVEVLELDEKGSVFVRAENGREKWLMLDQIELRTRKQKLNEFENDVLFKATVKQSIVIADQPALSGTLISVMDIDQDRRIKVMYGGHIDYIKFEEVEPIRGGEGVFTPNGLCLLTQDTGGTVLEAINISGDVIECQDFSGELKTFGRDANVRFHSRKAITSMSISEEGICKAQLTEEIAAAGFSKIPISTEVEIIDFDGSGYALFRHMNQQAWIPLEFISCSTGGPGVWLNEAFFRVCINGRWGEVIELVDDEIFYVQFSDKAEQVLSTEVDIFARFGGWYKEEVFFRSRPHRTDIIEIGEDGEYLAVCGDDFVRLKNDEVEEVRGGLGVISGNGLCTATLLEQIQLEDLVLDKSTIVDIIDFEKDNTAIQIELRKGIVPKNLLRIHTRRDFLNYKSDRALLLAKTNDGMVDVLDFDSNGLAMIRMKNGKEDWVAASDLDLCRGGIGVCSEDALFNVRILEEDAIAEVIELGKDGTFTVRKGDGNVVHVDSSLIEMIPRKAISSQDKFEADELFRARVVSEGVEFDGQEVRSGSFVSVIGIEGDQVKCRHYGRIGHLEFKQIEPERGGTGVRTSSGLCMATILETVILEGKRTLHCGSIVELWYLSKDAIIGFNRKTAEIDLTKLKFHTRVQGENQLSSWSIAPGKLSRKTVIGDEEYSIGTFAEGFDIDLTNSRALVSIQGSQGWIPLENINFQRGGMGISSDKSIFKVLNVDEFKEVSDFTETEQWIGREGWVGENDVIFRATLIDRTLVDVLEVSQDSLRVRDVLGDEMVINIGDAVPERGGLGVENSDDICMVKTIVGIQFGFRVIPEGSTICVKDLDNGGLNVEAIGQKGKVTFSQVQFCSRVSRQTSTIGHLHHVESLFKVHNPRDGKTGDVLDIDHYGNVLVSWGDDQNWLSLRTLIIVEEEKQCFQAIICGKSFDVSHILTNSLELASGEFKDICEVDRFAPSSGESMKSDTLFTCSFNGDVLEIVRFAGENVTTLEGEVLDISEVTLIKGGAGVRQGDSLCLAMFQDEVVDVLEGGKIVGENEIYIDYDDPSDLRPFARVSGKNPIQVNVVFRAKENCRFIDILDVDGRGLVMNSAHEWIEENSLEFLTGGIGVISENSLLKVWDESKKQMTEFFSTEQYGTVGGIVVPRWRKRWLTENSYCLLEGLDVELIGIDKESETFICRDLFSSEVGHVERVSCYRGGAGVRIPDAICSATLVKKWGSFEPGTVADVVSFDLRLWQARVKCGELDEKVSLDILRLHKRSEAAGCLHMSDDALFLVQDKNGRKHEVFDIDANGNICLDSGWTSLQEFEFCKGGIGVTNNDIIAMASIDNGKTIVSVVQIEDDGMITFRREDGTLETLPGLDVRLKSRGRDTEDQGYVTAKILEAGPLPEGARVVVRGLDASGSVVVDFRGQKMAMTMEKIHIDGRLRGVLRKGRKIGNANVKAGTLVDIDALRADGSVVVHTPDGVEIVPFDAVDFLQAKRWKVKDEVLFEAVIKNGIHDGRKVDVLEVNDEGKARIILGDKEMWIDLDDLGVIEAEVEVVLDENDPINGTKKAKIVGIDFESGQAWLDVDGTKVLFSFGQIRKANRDALIQEDVLFTGKLKSDINIGGLDVRQGTQVEIIDVDNAGRGLVRVGGLEDWVSLDSIEANRGGIGVEGDDTLFLAKLGEERVEVIDIDNDKARVRFEDGREEWVDLEALEKVGRLEAEGFKESTLFRGWSEDDAKYVEVEYIDGNGKRVWIGDRWIDLARIIPERGGAGVVSDQALFKAIDKQNGDCEVIEIQDGEALVEYRDGSRANVNLRDLEKLSRRGVAEIWNDEALCKAVLDGNRFVEVLEIDGNGNAKIVERGGKPEVVDFSRLELLRGGFGTRDDDSLFTALFNGVRCDVLEIDGTEVMLADQGWKSMDEIVKISRKGKRELSEDVLFAAEYDGMTIDIIAVDEQGNLRARGEGWLKMNQVEPQRGGIEGFSDFALCTGILHSGEVVEVRNFDEGGSVLIADKDGNESYVDIDDIQLISRHGELQLKDGAFAAAELAADVELDDIVLRKGRLVEVIGGEDGKIKIRSGDYECLVDPKMLKLQKKPNGRPLFQAEVLDDIKDLDLMKGALVNVTDIDEDGLLVLDDGKHVNWDQVRPLKARPDASKDEAMKALYGATLTYNFPDEELKIDDIIDVFIEEDEWAFCKKNDGTFSWIPRSYLRKDEFDAEGFNEYGEQKDWCAMAPNMQLREMILDFLSRSEVFSEARIQHDIEVFVDDIDSILREGRTVPGTLAALLYLDDEKRKFDDFEVLSYGVMKVREEWDPKVEEAIELLNAEKKELFADENVNISKIPIDMMLMESTAGGEGLDHIKHVLEANAKVQDLAALGKTIADLHTQLRELKKQRLVSAKDMVIQYLKEEGINMFKGFVDIDVRSLEQMIARGFSGEILIAYMKQIQEAGRKFDSFAEMMALIYQSHKKEPAPKEVLRSYARKSGHSEVKGPEEMGDMKYPEMTPQEKANLIMQTASNPRFKVFYAAQGNLQVAMEDIVQIIDQNPRFERAVCDMLLMNAKKCRYATFDILHKTQQDEEFVVYKQSLLERINDSNVYSEELKMEDFENCIVFGSIFNDVLLVIEDEEFVAGKPYPTIKDLCIALKVSDEKALANREVGQQMILEFLGSKPLFGGDPPPVYARNIADILDVAITGERAVEIMTKLQASGSRYSGFDELVDDIKNNIEYTI